MLQRCLAMVVQHKHRRLQLFGPLAERLRTAVLNTCCTPGGLPDTRPHAWKGTAQLVLASGQLSAVLQTHGRVLLTHSTPRQRSPIGPP